MARDENDFLHELKVDVEAELVVVDSSRPEEALGVFPEKCLFDPTDIERQEVGLRSLLGAVAATEGDSQRDHASD